MTTKTKTKAKAKRPAFEKATAPSGTYDRVAARVHRTETTSTRGQWLLDCQTCPWTKHATDDASSTMLSKEHQHLHRLGMIPAGGHDAR